MLCYHVKKPDDSPAYALGRFRIPGQPTDKGGCVVAMNYFAKGGSIPLVAKADRLSTVHRRVPLDLVVVPVREQGEVACIGVPVGVWTIQALSTPAADVTLPLLVLVELVEEFGFSSQVPRGKQVGPAFSPLPPY